MSGVEDLPTFTYSCRLSEEEEEEFCPSLRRHEKETKKSNFENLVFSKTSRKVFINRRRSLRVPVQNRRHRCAHLSRAWRRGFFLGRFLATRFCETRRRQSASAERSSRCSRGRSLHVSGLFGVALWPPRRRSCGKPQT